MDFSNIWTLIVKTNTFNFIIFAGIIAAICYFLNVPKMISNMQKNIEDTVTNSNNEREISKKNLDDAKAKMDNINGEIDGLIGDAQNTAKSIAEKIVLSSQGPIEHIENNTKKVLENNEDKTKKQLRKLTTKASIELVKNNLKTNLAQNPNLHQVFVDEAIDSIDTLEI